MRTHAYGALVLAAASSVMSQGVTAVISPPSPVPTGCQTSYSGQFQITVQNVAAALTAPKVKRDALQLTLSGGVLKDALGRTGYIADNYQFQFDGPPQAGAIYTAGFSVCGNGSLALGGSSIWWQCLSGDFYNLYDRNWAPQCNAIYINVLGAGAGTAPAGGAAPMTTVITSAIQRSDGQVYATTVTRIISQISDGQIQGPALTQLPDGQVNANTKPAPVGQISDGQIQATTAVPVSLNATAPARPSTALPVSVISDGQPQAPTAVASSVRAVTSASTRASTAPLLATANAGFAHKGQGAAVLAGVAAFALF